MKILFIAGPIVLILAIVGGLIAFKVIPMPGAKPPVTKAAAPKTPDPVKKPTPPPVAKKPATPKAPTVDLKKGAETLAGLWNNMDIPTLVGITKDWKDEDLVVVLGKMDEAKVAEYLTAVEKAKPAHASALSKLVQIQAGTVAVEQG